MSFCLHCSFLSFLAEQTATTGCNWARLFGSSTMCPGGLLSSGSVPWADSLVSTKDRLHKQVADFAFVLWSTGIENHGHLIFILNVHSLVKFWGYFLGNNDIQISQLTLSQEYDWARMHRGGMWFSNCLWQPSCINSGGRGMGRIFQFKSTSVDGVIAMTETYIRSCICAWKKEREENRLTCLDWQIPPKLFAASLPIL